MNSISFLHEYATSGIKIIQFNVGQGDHILLQFPDKEYAIVDFFCDYGDDCAEDIEPPAVKYFRCLQKALPSEKIRIKFVCLSHLDSDHILSLENSLLTLTDELKISVDKIWIPKALDFDDSLQEMFNSYDDFRRAIETFVIQKDQQKLAANMHSRIAFLHGPKFKKKLKYIDDQTSPIIDSLIRMEFCGPDVNVSQRSNFKDHKMWAKLLVAIAFSGGKQISFPDFNIDRNELSIVFKVCLDKEGALFTGDAGKASLHKIIGNGVDLRSRFIKVPHHGSKNSSSQEIWKSVLPTDGVVLSGISAGLGYDHPHVETINDMVGATDKNVTHYILNTNLSHEEIDKLSIEKVHTDLFAYEEKTDRYKHLRNVPHVIIPEHKVDATKMGLLGFLQVIQPDVIPHPQALLSPRTRIYNDPISHCPRCIK